jgi:hypothetical protein
MDFIGISTYVENIEVDWVDGDIGDNKALTQTCKNIGGFLHSYKIGISAEGTKTCSMTGLFPIWRHSMIQYDCTGEWGRA